VTDFDSIMQEGGGLPVAAASPASTTLQFCRPTMAHFGDAAAEYEAVLKSAAVFDLSDRSLILLQGSDRTTFLNNLCSNDVARLSAGQGCEAFLTNVKGRILAHIMVLVGSDDILVETSPGLEQSLLDHLDRYLIREDVVLKGMTGQLGELLVCGPTAAATLSSLGIEVTGLHAYQHLTATCGGHELRAMRVDWLAAPGYLLSTERLRLPALWKSICAAGAVAAGSMSFHAARIAAAFPLHGLDISEDNLAQEANRTQLAISFTKGCYLGQEPIARIDAIGHINRELCTLRFPTTVLPGPADSVFDMDGNRVGDITSAALIPGTREGVALAMLRTSVTRPRATVRIQHQAEPDSDAAAIEAQVVGP
jgi:folate-binding protein YgfZ